MLRTSRCGPSMARSQRPRCPNALRALPPVNITGVMQTAALSRRLQNVRIKSRCGQAPRQHVASHNARSMFTGGRRCAPGAAWPESLSCSARTSMCAFLRPPSPRCAWTDLHRFGESVATRSCACYARPHSGVRATRPRLLRAVRGVARGCCPRLRPDHRPRAGQQGGRVRRRSMPSP